MYAIGDLSVSIMALCSLGDKVIIQRLDSAGGQELWASDGTVDGTVKMAAVQIVDKAAFTPELIIPNEEKIIDDVLYFGGFTDDAGYELWRTDGTLTGTYMVEDYIPGFDGLQPSGISRLGNQLLFEGYSADDSFELHRFVPEPSASNDIAIDDTSLALSPNPINGLFKVEWASQADYYRAELVDLQGRRLWTNPQLSSGKYQEVDLPSGIYILKLSNERKILSRKLIIQ